MAPVSLWIDNRDVESDVVFSVHNHGTQTVTSAFGATPELATWAITSCHDAFTSWKDSTPWQRRDLFNKAATLLDQRRDEVAQLLRVCLILQSSHIHTCSIAMC